MKVGLGGFPNIRNGIRDRFSQIAKDIQFDRDTDIRILCIHQSIEGAKVGPKNYTFKYDADTISSKDLDGKYHVIFSGHIHRHQVLEHDLRGEEMKTPVYYAGSTERTAFAELNEKKGFIQFNFSKDAKKRILNSWEFITLPTRPMYQLNLDLNGIDDSIKLERFIEFQLKQFEQNSQVKINFESNTNTDLISEAIRLINKKSPGKMIVTYRGL